MTHIKLCVGAFISSTIITNYLICIGTLPPVPVWRAWCHLFFIHKKMKMPLIRHHDFLATHLNFVPLCFSMLYTSHSFFTCVYYLLPLLPFYNCISEDVEWCTSCHACIVVASSCLANDIASCRYTSRSLLTGFLCRCYCLPLKATLLQFSISSGFMTILQSKLWSWQY